MGYRTLISKKKKTDKTQKQTANYISGTVFDRVFKALSSIFNKIIIIILCNNNNKRKNSHELESSGNVEGWWEEMKRRKM